MVILLASRTRLHRFVKRVLTEQELHDLLLLAAAALVVLPLAPDRAVGPLSVLNPRTIWRLVVIFMAISGAGYIGLRLLGPGIGLALPVSRRASSRAPRPSEPWERGRARTRPCARARRRSSLDRGHGHPDGPAPRRHEPTDPVGAALAAHLLRAAAAYAAASSSSRPPAPDSLEGAGRPRVPSPAAVGFAAIVAAVTLASAAIHQWLGERGLVLAAGVAGFADAHAAAIGAASVAAAGHIPPDAAVIPILAALSTNTITKATLAVLSRDRAFALEVLPGLLLVIGAAWTAWAIF